jgi:nucleoid-associated protein YgaU
MTSDGSKPKASNGRDVVQAQAARMSPASKADFTDTQSHASETTGETTIYTVMAGDTLTTIASHFYGDFHKAELILAANRDQLSGPDRITPGQMLKIPAKP